MKKSNRDKLGKMSLLMVAGTVLFLALLISIVVIRERQIVKETYNLRDEEADLHAMFDKMKLLNSCTQEDYQTIQSIADSDAGQLMDETVCRKIDEKLQEKYSFLIIENQDSCVFIGNPDYQELLYGNLEDGVATANSRDVTFVNSTEKPVIYKRIPFILDENQEGNAYIVTKTNVVLPHVRFLIIFLPVIFFVALIVIVAVLWVYTHHRFIKPIKSLQKVVGDMSEGNLEAELPIDDKGEFSELYEMLGKMQLRLKESIEEQQRADTLTREVIGNISHDLKTPLTAIKGYSEGILDGLAATPDRLEKYVGTIHTKAVDMTGLVDELAFFTKINQKDVLYNFTNVNASRYFGDSIGDLMLDLDVKGIQLIFQNHLDDTVQISIDAEKMKRVINNIIGNASKYIRHNRGIILVKLTDEGEKIRIRIEDNGSGIEEAELPYIFDRFYRTDSSRNSNTGGSGLGLAITKKIIEDHGGEIGAESKEGIGTAIFFRLNKKRI